MPDPPDFSKHFHLVTLDQYCITPKALGHRSFKKIWEGHLGVCVMHAYVRVCACPCIYIYTHVHTQTHIHTCTYIGSIT